MKVDTSFHQHSFHRFRRKLHPDNRYLVKFMILVSLSLTFIIVGSYLLVDYFVQLDIYYDSWGEEFFEEAVPDTNVLKNLKHIADSEKFKKLVKHDSSSVDNDVTAVIQ